MLTHNRWAENWRVLAPPASVRLSVPLSARKRRRAAAMVQRLSPGTPVVLIDAAPGSRARCRRFAERAGLEVVRAFVAVPSGRRPAYLVEDAWGPMQYFSTHLLTVPPRLTTLAAPAEGLIRLVRRLGPWHLIGDLIPGRVVVGRRAA